MGTGYIKLYRSLLDSYVWQLPPAQFKVAIKIFTSVNWTPKYWAVNGEVLLIHRGQFVTSVRGLAADSKVSEGAVRRALANLSKGKTISTQATQHYTIISVINFDKYQPEQGEADTPGDTHSVGHSEGRSDQHSEGRSVHNEEITNKKSSERSQPPQAIELADKLRAHILSRQPDHSKLQPKTWPRTQRLWADSFRLAHEQDARDWADMGRVLDWCQRDSFWQSNILSGSKFRSQFDTLKAKAKTTTPAPSVRATVGGLFGAVHE